MIRFLLTTKFGLYCKRPSERCHICQADCIKWTRKLYSTQNDSWTAIPKQLRYFAKWTFARSQKRAERSPFKEIHRILQTGKESPFYNCESLTPVVTFPARFLQWTQRDCNEQIADNNQGLLFSLNWEWRLFQFPPAQFQQKQETCSRSTKDIPEAVSRKRLLKWLVTLQWRCFAGKVSGYRDLRLLRVRQYLRSGYLCGRPVSSGAGKTRWHLGDCIQGRGEWQHRWFPHRVHSRWVYTVENPETIQEFRLFSFAQTSLNYGPCETANWLCELVQSSMPWDSLQTRGNTSTSREDLFGRVRFDSNYSAVLKR